VTSIAAARPGAGPQGRGARFPGLGAGVDGPVAHVGPVLATVMLVLRATINRLNRGLIVPALRRGFGPWLATPAGGYLLLLGTRGRRSGLPRLAPLSYRVADGSIWVLAGFGPATQWYRNLLANPVVEVRLPGRDVRCRATSVLDATQRRRIAPALVRSTGLPGLLIGCNPWTALDERILEQLEGVPLIRLDPVDGPIEPGPDDPGGRAWVWRQGSLAALVLLIARVIRRSRPAPQRVS
jgi:deazaflavin-dependent oxidoreductase (nitroreductase family)